MDTKKELKPIKVSQLNHKLLAQLKLDLNVKTIDDVISALLEPYRINAESAYAQMKKRGSADD